MLYRNKKTGAVIDVQSECGGDWELIEETVKEEKAEPTPKPRKGKKK